TRRPWHALRAAADSGGACRFHDAARWPCGRAPPLLRVRGGPRLPDAAPAGPRAWPRGPGNRRVPGTAGRLRQGARTASRRTTSGSTLDFPSENSLWGEYGVNPRPDVTELA